LLGDPSFPDILIDATQGEKILRCQELYREYSRLSLSIPFDRPVAIDALQQRLLRTLKVKGGFGMFDEGVTRGLLCRSLLWRRGSDTASLSRIDFPPDRIMPAIPSWSWMAFTGGIDYLQPDFGSVRWEDLQSPWSTARLRNGPYNAGSVLIATLRECDLGSAWADQAESELIFDDPDSPPQFTMTCLVLGKHKGSPSAEAQRHYILLVTATLERDGDGKTLYERAGVGYVPGRCISPEGSLASIV
jgi:hypothetical protein